MDRKQYLEHISLMASRLEIQARSLSKLIGEQGDLISYSDIHEKQAIIKNLASIVTNKESYYVHVE